jgi:hypothetical protein
MRRWFSVQVLGAAFALMLALAGTTSAALAADPRDFVLVNNTGQLIHFIYVSPSNQTEWGDDVLGRDVLDDGDQVTILFPSARFTPGDCLYDIKVVTESGDEGQLGQVNLCETHTVTFNG